jgi:ABC-2 type transport system permease protein
VALKYLLLALPFSHPTIAASALALKDYTIVIGGIIYLGLFTLAVLLIAARMFNTERVVTAKITFGRRKSKRKP